MPDIVHRFPINAPIDAVFRGVTTPGGLDAWWTLQSTGAPVEGSDYGLSFGPSYQWRAKVVRAAAPTEFEIVMTKADDDWLGTSVSFDLEARGGATNVLFRHRGWKTANDHFQTSSFCWAMYLRLLKRRIETGEFVEYAARLEV